MVPCTSLRTLIYDSSAVGIIVEKGYEEQSPHLVDFQNADKVQCELISKSIVSKRLRNWQIEWGLIVHNTHLHMIANTAQFATCRSSLDIHFK
jgi:hypothetical protein